MPDSSTNSAHRLPDYLRNTYSWAYLDHRTVPWLDRPVVVSAILWGNASRLMDAAVREFAPATAARGSVVLGGAMGVPQTYYAPFAQWLAAQGWRVTTFDYRGHGDSLALLAAAAGVGALSA